MISVVPCRHFSVVVDSSSPMTPFIFFRGAVGVVLLGLTGCGVYMPLLPPTPLLQRGQVEISAAAAPFAGLANLTTSPKPTGLWLPALEGNVAWAPARHLTLVFSGGTTYVGRLHRPATQYVRNRQWTASAGWHTAWTAQEGSWYVAVLAGIGRGNSALSKQEEDQDSGLFTTPGHRVSSYEASFRSQSIQTYATRSAGSLSVTGTVRFTMLAFDEIRRRRRFNDTDLPAEFVPVVGVPTMYLEPAVSVRVGPHRCQALAGLGLAIPLQHPTQPPPTQLAPYQKLLLMASAGAVVRLGR